MASPVDSLDTMRIDKWLWVARFFKTRSDANRLVASGRLRLDGEPMSKPHRQVSEGHVLTFPKGEDIRVIRVLAMSPRRRPVTEARLLYDDLAPPEPRERRPKDTPPPFEQRDKGAGRPTKRERRQIDSLKS
ncbi:RNA-binding S4 domain-containing protein [Alphaproteobacteria bacterium LSUCC0684]